MAFTQISAYEYIAASADEKPTDGITTGSRCREYDTDDLYYFDGTAWRAIDDKKRADLAATLAWLQALSLDSVFTGKLSIIEIEHSMVHAGDSYRIDHVTADDSPLANDASLEARLTTPAGGFPHVIPTFWCEGLSQAYVFEGTTFSSDGDDKTPVQRNRNSSNTSVLTIRTDPTVDSDGTALWDGVWSGVEGLGPLPGAQAESRGSHEIILKPSTEYLFRVTARDNGLRASIRLDWYE